MCAKDSTTIPALAGEHRKASPRDGLASLVLGLALMLSGCAREAHPAGPTPPLVYAEDSPSHESVARASLPRYRYRATSATIEGGNACLGWLARRGVEFEVLDPKPGMVTPIRVHSRLGGVAFQVNGKPDLVCDCRLAAVLEFLSPEFGRLGVTAIHHSGAYAYRTTRKGRLSLHALGLAVDVHSIDMGGYRFDIKKHYRRGDPSSFDDCYTNSALNSFACRMRQTRLFQELLTPDDNADHHDHLHLAIAPYTDGVTANASQ